MSRLRRIFDSRSLDNVKSRLKRKPRPSPFGTLELCPVEGLPLATTHLDDLCDFQPSTAPPTAPLPPPIPNFPEIPFSDLEVQTCLESNPIVNLYKTLWRNPQSSRPPHGRRRRRQRPRLVVLKTFRWKTSQFDLQEFYLRLRILTELNHPSILKIWGCTQSIRRIAIVVELGIYGGLWKFLSKHQTLPMRERVRLLYEMSSALSYIHLRGIVHLDVRIQAFVVDSKLRARINDFGLSRLTTEETLYQARQFNQYQARMYYAPETETTPPDCPQSQMKPIDVFAFAIVMWIVLTGNSTPYPNMKSVQLKVRNSPNMRPDVTVISPEGMPYEAYAYLVECMTRGWAHSSEEREDFVWMREKLQLAKEKCVLQPEFSYVYPQGVDPGLGLGEVEDEGEEGDYAQFEERMLLLAMESPPIDVDRFRREMGIETEDTTSSSSSLVGDATDADADDTDQQEDGVPSPSPLSSAILGDDDVDVAVPDPISVLVKTEAMEDFEEMQLPVLSLLGLKAAVCSRFEFPMDEDGVNIEIRKLVHEIPLKFFCVGNLRAGDRLIVFDRRTEVES